MPAAATTWFTSPVSTASTKAATLANTTSRHGSDDADAPSFLDSLHAAAENTKTTAQSSDDTAEEPVAKDASENLKNTAAKPQKKAERSNNKKKTSRSDDTDEKSHDVESADAQPAEASEVESSDETSKPQSDIPAADQVTDPATVIDTTLATVTQTVAVQDPEVASELTQDQAVETPIDTEKKNDLHLPWRHYHEKPQINAEQDSASSDDDAESAVAASAIDADAQPLPPEETRLKKQDPQKHPDTGLTAQTSENDQAVQEQVGQQSTDSDQDGQDQQAGAEQNIPTPTKASKPKVPLTPPHETPQPHTQTAKTESGVQASATMSAAATAPQTESVVAEATPAAKEVMSQLDSTATLITDQHARHDAQPQTGAAASARSAQETAQESHADTYDQVVLGLRTKIDPKNTKAEIHLNPPELGALKVSVSISNGQLTAEFTAQNQMVRDLLSNNMERLRSVLEGQGVAVDRLAVQTARGAEVAPSQSSPQQESQNSFDSQHDGRSNGNMGQSQQRSPQRQNTGEFAAMLGQEKPLDMVA